MNPCRRSLCASAHRRVRWGGAAFGFVQTTLSGFLRQVHNVVDA